MEFGAKAHILQVDGLTFIDKLDFHAFNERTRLKLSVVKDKRVFIPAKQLGADRIYAINSNRRFCTDNSLFTCFHKKGPKKQSKPEKVLSSEISKQRAIVMEGVFGTNKNFYGLCKIRVKKGESDDIFGNNESEYGIDCQKKTRKRKSTGNENGLKTGSEKPIMG